MIKIPNKEGGYEGLEQRNDAEFLRERAVIGSWENLDPIASEFIEKMKENGVVALGETHQMRGPRELVSKLISSLKKEAGLTHIVLEIQSRFQNDVDIFLETGEIPKGFKEWLDQKVAFDPRAYLEILASARKSGLKIIAADPRTDADKSYHDEDHLRNFEHLLKIDGNRILLLYGSMHVATSFGLRADSQFKSLGQLLKDRTEGKAYLIKVNHELESHPPAESKFSQALIEGKFTGNLVMVPIAGSPFESDPAMPSYGRKLFGYQYNTMSNNFDASCYVPPINAGRESE